MIAGTETEIAIYTDGACSGNPGPGGWGVVWLARRNGRIVREREDCGGAAQSTNNRMEMTAVIEALSRLRAPSDIILFTDSRYVKDGLEKWLSGWKRNGWRTAAKKAVKNEDLWRRLDALSSCHRIDWRWVKGHAGDGRNEQADALARRGMAPYLKALKERGT